MNKFNETPFTHGVWSHFLVTAGNKKASVSGGLPGVKISENKIIFPKGYKPLEVHVEVDAKDKCPAFEWPDRVSFEKGQAIVILPELECYNTLIYHVLG